MLRSATDLRLVIYVDGSSVPNPGPSGIGLLALATVGGVQSLLCVAENIGFAGNNTAEFAGLSRAARLIQEVKPASALIVSDSRVALRFATGLARPRSGEHLAWQRSLSGWFAGAPGVRLCWVERRRNLAHHLARHAATLAPGARVVTEIDPRASQPTAA